jgi:hypothetical protein
VSSPQIQTQLFPPPSASPVADAMGYIAKPFRNWLFSVQYLLPLITVDTSAGAQVIALPSPGNEASGQSNQNQELIYRKISTDGNTVTINGSADGPIVLTTGDKSATSRVRFKSDGTNWWVVG